MSNEPIAPLKRFFSRVWNDPLYFFCALMLASIVGLVAGGSVLSNANFSYFKHHFQRTELVIAILLILGVIFGVLGTILSFIAPVRHLLERLLHRRLFWLACVVTVIALFYAEEDWRGRHDLLQYERPWMAKGIKFDFLETIPPAVPEDQNFALTPIVASSYATYMDKNGHELDPQDTNVIDRLKMISYGDTQYGNSPATGNWPGQTTVDLKAWQDYYRALAAKTNQFPVPARPGSPAADVLFALGKYDSAIEELRQASQLPDSRFPLPYGRDEPAGVLLPHLAALKQATVTLRLRACAEIQNGQIDAALADIKLMLYLMGSVRTEPVLISHLVRIAQLDITLQPVYEGLAGHRWSDLQLTALETELAKVDFFADYGTAMRGELTFGIRETEYLRRERNFQALDYGHDGNHPQTAAFDLGLELMPDGFFYQNELQLARMNLDYLAPIMDTDKRIISPGLVQQRGQTATNDFNGHGAYAILARMTFPAILNSVEKFARAQSHVDMARVALALERFNLANGSYPTSLDSLAPRFITALPHDIINGQPLIYRRTADDQFVLYSVGWNETDDGGVVVIHKKDPKDEGVIDQDQGDWVWKYPAK